MNTQKYIFIAFFLMVIAQLYIPARMIMQREQILETGALFKFKTAPVDPNDPFRGKYIALDFEANRVNTDAEAWNDKYGLEVYIELGKDENGFAKINQIHESAPTATSDYVKAKIRSISDQEGIDKDYITIAYPFDRFYMEESKAGDAEVIYRDAQGEKEAYALVRVQDGEALIVDVMIDNVSVREAVEAHQNMK